MTACALVPTTERARPASRGPTEPGVQWTPGRAVARSASAEGERSADFPVGRQSGRGRPGGRGIAAAPGRATAAGFVDGQIRLLVTLTTRDQAGRDPSR